MIANSPSALVKSKWFLNLLSNQAKTANIGIFACFLQPREPLTQAGLSLLSNEAMV